MTEALVIRLGLGYLAVMNALIGFWAAFAPRSFFDEFPGIGAAWVAVDGPYNEHLVRDVGAFSLALCFVFVVAIVAMQRTVVLAAAGAAVVVGIPHLVYHARNTEGLAGPDLFSSLGGLVLAIVLPFTVIVLARRMPN